METFETKQTLLDVALLLWSARGYNAVGVQELVVEAGVTKPTLYHHFGSKDGLLRALLTAHYAPLNDALRAAARYTPNPKQYQEDIYPVLKAVCHAYFDIAARDTAFILMSLALSFSPESAEETSIVRPFLVEQYGILDGLFRDIAAVHTNLRGKENRLARNFLALIHSDIVFWKSGYGKLNDEATHHLVHQFMHGIFA
jgi:TetR/AcrR family transcriptional regulator